jgi:hypothetical protein
VEGNGQFMVSPVNLFSHSHFLIGWPEAVVGVTLRFAKNDPTKAGISAWRHHMKLH